MSTRLEDLENRESNYKEYKANRAEEQNDFLNLGRRLASTKDGREFFLLAKKLFYDSNEYKLDTFFEGSSPFIIDPLHLARINGEDYILRKVVTQFLNNDGISDNIAYDSNNQGGRNV